MTLQWNICFSVFVADDLFLVYIEKYRGYVAAAAAAAAMAAAQRDLYINDVT